MGSCIVILCCGINVLEGLNKISFCNRAVNPVSVKHVQYKLFVVLGDLVTGYRPYILPKKQFECRIHTGDSTLLKMV